MSSQRASKVFTGIKRARSQRPTTIIYYVQEPPLDTSTKNGLPQSSINILNNKKTSTIDSQNRSNGNDGLVIPDVLTSGQLTQATTEKGLQLHGCGIYFLTEKDNSQCAKSVMTTLGLERIGDSKILKFYWVNPPTNNVFLGNKRGEYVITMKSGKRSENASDFLIFNGKKPKSKTNSEDAEGDRTNVVDSVKCNDEEEIMFFSNKASVMVTVVRNVPGGEKIYIDIISTGGY